MKEYSFTIGRNNYNVLIKEVTNDTILAEVNGQEHTVSIDQISNIGSFLDADEITVAQQSRTTTMVPITPKTGQIEKDIPTAPIEAPIPGQIISVSVKVGDKVKKGQKLLTLEAMKLENAITADRDGTIKEIYVATGDIVSQGQKLIAID